MKLSKTLSDKDNPTEETKTKELKIEDLPLWNAQTAEPGKKYRNAQGSIIVKS
tara:strand:+ start:14908 stop:15066 length:159 start_codon:yes stop_codon:yes gene_type:complete